MREDDPEIKTAPVRVVAETTASKALDSFIKVIGVFIVIIVLASGFQSYIMLQQRWALNRAAVTIHDQAQRSKDAEQLFDSIRTLLISGLLNNPHLTPDQQRILNDLQAQQVRRDTEKAKQASTTTTTRPKVKGGDKPPTTTVPGKSTTTTQQPTTTTSTTRPPLVTIPPLPTLPKLPCLSTAVCPTSANLHLALPITHVRWF